MQEAGFARYPQLEPNSKSMMKTKLTLFVAVIAVALFGVGCASSSLNTGLVAHYPFNGNAMDESGNGNHGEVKGATLAADRHGKEVSAYSFSVKKNSYIEVPTSNASPWSHARTISLWLKFQGDTRGIPIRNYADNAGGGVKWNIFCLNNKDASTTVQWMCSPSRPANIGRGVSSGPMALSPDEWFKLTVLNKDEGVELFLNGEFIASSMGKVQLNEIAPNNYPLLIGGWMEPGHIQGEFDGEIDDIRIYSRALSSAEVKALYDLEKPKGK